MGGDEGLVGGGGRRRWQVPQGQGRWQDCRVSRGPAQAPGLKSSDARGLPGLKPWVMIGSKWSGGGAACSGKWTEVHAAAVPPMIGSVCQGGGAQVPGLKSAAIGHSCPMAMG